MATIAPRMKQQSHDSPPKLLARFLAAYTPAIQRRARAALGTLRKRLPGAIELVYDNYNALVIAFGPTERASEIVLSIALYPSWVTLFFLWGTKLHDPTRRLSGSGKQVRQIRLDDASTLDEPAVRALIANAASLARPPIDRKAKRRLVIKSVSAKQRARRPSE
jgi:hypothetical protein